jgi:F0F1-type ATP synthase membrane subunit b/b'
MDTGTIVRLIVLATVVFLGLVLVFRRVLSSHMDVAMKKIQKLNEENLRREMELKRKLDETERAYQNRLVEAEKEAMRLKDTAEQEAQELKNRIIAEVNEQRMEIIKEAKDEAESYRIQVNQELHQLISKQATKLITAVLTRDFVQTIHHQLVEQALKEFGSYKELNPDRNRTNKVEIISCLPLTTEEKKRLMEVLKTKIGPEVTIAKETTSDNLIAGLYLKIGDLVIDGTLNNRINQYLKQH